MTRDELLEDIKPEKVSGTQVERLSIRDIKFAMKQYAKQKCAEQRYIIAKGLPDRCFVDIDESWIMSMDEPQFN